jgi:hypothetical protein
MRLWTALLVILGAVNGAAAQQGSVQISSSTQVIAADPQRRSGQEAVADPASLARPARAAPSSDLHAVQRGQLHPGTAAAGSRLQTGRFTWTGGWRQPVTPSPPRMPSPIFSRRAAPAAKRRAAQPRASVTTAGRVTALRNILIRSAGIGQTWIAEAFRPHTASSCWRTLRVRIRHGRVYGVCGRGADPGGVMHASGPDRRESAQTPGGRVLRAAVIDARGQHAGRRNGVAARLVQVNAQRFVWLFAVINTPFPDREGIRNRTSRDRSAAVFRRRSVPHQSDPAASAPATHRSRALSQRVRRRATSRAAAASRCGQNRRPHRGPGSVVG